MEFRIRISIFFILIFLLMIFSGCEKIIEDVTSFKIIVKKTMYENKSVNSSTENTEVINILEQGVVTKVAPGYAKLMGFIVEEVEIPDVDVFESIVQANGFEFSGSLTNGDDKDVVFGIYFSSSGSLSDPKTEATLIATINLSGLETKSLNDFSSFNQTQEEIKSNILDFFSENPEISQMYVYLTGDPQPVNITVQNLAIQLKPSYYLPYILSDDNNEYDQYRDRVENVTDVHISGSIVNNGDDEVEIRFTVQPSTTVPGIDWEGEVLVITVPAHTTLELSDWSTYLVPGGLDRLKDAIYYLIDDDGSVLIELFMESDSGIDIEIISMVLEGSISVEL